MLVSGLMDWHCFGGFLSPPVFFCSCVPGPAHSHAAFCSVRPGAIAQTAGSSLLACTTEFLFLLPPPTISIESKTVLFLLLILLLLPTYLYFAAPLDSWAIFSAFFAPLLHVQIARAARWTKPASRLPRKERGVAIRSWIRTSLRCLFSSLFLWSLARLESHLSSLTIFSSTPVFARLSVPFPLQLSLPRHHPPGRPAICAARTITTYPLSSPPSGAIAAARGSDCQRGIGSDPHICCAWLTLPRICSSSASVPLHHRHVIVDVVVVVAESGRRDYNVCPLLT